MTSEKRHREVLARKHRRLLTGLETVDAQWRAYHRHIFQICAERLSLSEELVQFALTGAEPQELSALATAAEMVEINELGETGEPETASNAGTPSSAGTPSTAGPRSADCGGDPRQRPQPGPDTGCRF